MKSLKFLLFSALVILLFLIPVFVDNLYWISVFTKWWIYILLTVSFWLIMSTGQVNLAHAGFAAIGGYISGALVQSYGWNSWAALPVGVLTAGLIALVLGYITLRITGIYFIIMSVALAGFIQTIFGIWDHPFGGLVGLQSLPHPDAFLGINLSSRPALYYLILICMLLVVILVYRIYYSSMGRIFRGINSSDRLAEHVGIDIMKYKVMVFVIGCLCAGLGGVLFTYYTSTIVPTSFTLTQSTYYIVYCAVGGLLVFPGPIIGTLVLCYISELIKAYAEYQNIIFSVLLIAAMLLFKGGLYGLYQRFINWISHVTKRNETPVKSI